jgi:hypothetical protein
MITTFIIFNLFVSICVAFWAQKLGRDFWTTMFVGIALTPIVLVISLWGEMRKSNSVSHSNS